MALKGSRRPARFNIDSRTKDAVSFFWKTRRNQAVKQTDMGSQDQGNRGKVTGGKQMDGFIGLFVDLIKRAGMPESAIFLQKATLQIPGFFRPTKEWDLLVVKDGQLIVALEAKSQVGPSFGNNFNNRTEEALGSSVCLWTAFREGAFNKTVKPWLGYIFVLEDSPRSRSPVSVSEPHFKVFPEFVNASYAKRYELFCRKLVRERNYDAAAFITSAETTGLNGIYDEPAEDLTMELFAKSLIAQVSTYLGTDLT
jgi:hypothetical protein